jgi:hypothetical protein
MHEILEIEKMEIQSLNSGKFLKKLLHNLEKEN